MRTWTNPHRLEMKVLWDCGCIRVVHPNVKTPPMIYKSSGPFGYCDEHKWVRGVATWTEYVSWRS